MSLGFIIYQLGQLYSFCIIVYCIFTWFPIRQGGVLGDIFAFFKTICEPYLKLFQKLIPPIGGAVDITPIIALLVLQLLVGLLVRIL